MSKKKIKYGPFTTLYKGRIFNIKQREVFYSNGHKELHEYCERFDSVTILAFDNKKRLLLTREFRTDEQKYVWFLPTGKIDGNEKPHVAAQRELQEESGFKAKTMRLVFKRPASSGYFLWNIYVYIAKDLVFNPLKRDEQFAIEVVPTSFKKATQMALDGTITNQFLAYYIIRIEYMIRQGLLKL